MLAFDSKHYHDMAVQLVHGYGFMSVNGVPFFYRLPGYPLFLAACYKLCHLNVIATLMVQLFFGSLIPVLMYVFSLIILPTRRLVAFGAAFFACLHVGFIVYSGLILSDMMFLLLWMFFLICFFYALKSKRILIFLFAGVALGIASLIRPMGLPLFLVVLLIIFLSRRAFLVNLKSGLFLFCGWISIVGWWIVRNFLLTGYLFFHTLSGPHFLNHSAARIIMMKNNVSYEQAKGTAYQRFDELIAEKELIENRQLLEIERVIVAEKLTLSVMLSNPMLAIKHAMGNVFKTCFSLYSSELLFIDSGGQLPPYSCNRTLKDMIMRFLMPNINAGYLRYIIWGEIALYLLTLIGFFCFVINSFWFRRKLFLVLSSLLVMIFFVGITFACGYARFRLPIEPFLIVYACAFLVDFFKIKV